VQHQILEALRRASWDSPAVPLHDLVEILRRQGVAVTERSIRGALAGAGAAGRLLGPILVRPSPPPGRSSSRMGPGGSRVGLREPQADTGGPHPPHGASALVAGLGCCWVVLCEKGDDDPGPDAPPSARLRRTLLFLGRRVDERSPRDVGRWLALVAEGDRYRDAA
jgi:hypothetical protein